MKTTLRVRDWKHHQHFRDRRPPWIKVHREHFLEGMAWHELSPQAAKMLIGILLVASDDEHHSGTLPDVKTLAFRLRVSVDEIQSVLPQLGHWLEEVGTGDSEQSVSTSPTLCYQDDINVISDRYQVVPPETETETETDVHEPSVHAVSSTDLIQKSSPKKQAHQIEKPSNVEPEVWNDFVKHRKAIKAPLTQTALKGIENEAVKASITLNDCLQEICLRGWRGFKADWIAGTQGQSKVLDLGSYT